MMKRFNCEEGCCNYLISDYKHPATFQKNDNWKEKEHKIKKAGAFIVDIESHKILLVQSRGQYWGPPKGSIDPDEKIDDCAIREVKEETGLEISKEDLDKYYVVKGKALYYFINMKETEIKVQNHIQDNDANGIGWFNVDCLSDLINQEKITINQHCKILIKKFLSIDIQSFLLEKINSNHTPNSITDNSVSVDNYK